MTAQQSLSDTMAKHARTCKKSPSDCPACQKSINYHASLPLTVLSDVLNERRKR
jgi:hypothetical protein